MAIVSPNHHGKTPISILANASADFQRIQDHAGWVSATVAQGYDYFEQNKKYKQEITEKLIRNMLQESAPKL